MTHPSARAICLAGPVSVGKTLVASLIRDASTGARIFSYDDVFRNMHHMFAEEYLDGSGIWMTKRQTHEQRNILKAQCELFWGEEALSLALHNLVLREGAGAPMVILDGVQSVMDVHLAAHMQNGNVLIRTVFLDSSPQIRYERHCERAYLLKQKPLSAHEFFAKQSIPSHALQMLRSQADVVLHNDGDIEDIHAQVVKYVL